MYSDFNEQCETWRSKRACDTVIRDVYDGRVWKKFQYACGSAILVALFTYALMLSRDWFQPYAHTVTSIGVIYLAVMNLPRHVLYKRKNIVLLGIIPGPSEPSHDINTFLIPLVHELKQFWLGVLLKVTTAAGVEERVVRCALLSVACGLPAGRKVCGFLSHSATKGCSKRLKAFSGTAGNMLYSGFNRSLWPPRTSDDHRRDVELVLACNTKTTRAKKESELGCRYSVLLELPYVDAPTMLVIDPMHNLFLGSCKRVLSVWLKLGLLDGSKLEQTQHFEDSVIVPCNVSRIPLKTETGFGGFKADQFKTWIILYSIPTLFDILPQEHLECWHHFVLACRILCQHILSYVELDLADALLMHFCKRVERMYGEDVVTPNMHMHGHLKEVLLDYGPMEEFWLFSFERYNGVLGRQPTNYRAVEPQLMSRFLKDNMATSCLYPYEFAEVFRPVFDLDIDKRIGNSVNSLMAEDAIRLPSRHSRGVLTSSEIPYSG